MLPQQDNNEYVRAALLAAEEGVRAAATGALPLAAPIVERVGGWEAVDDWACRGIDRVAQAAPIITKPTEEVMCMGFPEGTADRPPRVSSWLSP